MSKISPLTSKKIVALKGSKNIAFIAVFLLTVNILYAQEKSFYNTVEHHYANNDGINIHYVTTGKKEKPLILFVHGFPDFWYSWKDQMEFFSKDYYVASIDLRGYNLSDKPKGVDNYTFDILINDLLAVIRDIGNKSIYLVAHDWGAAISWRLAARNPRLIKKLVILSVPHPKAGDKKVEVPFNEKETSYVDTFISEEFKQNLNENWFSNKVTNDYDKQLYNTAFEKSDKNAMINYYKANVQNSENYNKEYFLRRNDNLQNIKMPVLIIHGKKDQFLITKDHNNTWEHVDNDLTINVLSNAGHFVHHDESKKVISLINYFLSSEEYNNK
ncbi:alpha/beta fold hydrolase [Lacinutrix iliipiscaria]|uniref:Alpha/beta fold hydrolase n=1 Tax=Lacinutrix iliipiscaria TaxID=1230532 RepID=A0ABW5WMU1_9FLAO